MNIRTTQEEPRNQGSGGRAAGRGGFTLIELSLVIVIIGILMAGGIGSWYMVLDGRRLAETKAAMYDVKNCLIQRMYLSNTYPSHTATLDCETAGGYDLALDLDHCLCKHRDAYGWQMYYVEGVYEDTDTGTFNPLSTNGVYILADDAMSQNGTTPHDDQSTVIDKDGNTIKSVAFVLISRGRDRTFDDTSYGNLFAGNDHAATLNRSDPPDFTFDTDDDDIYLYVTAPELVSRLTE